MIIAAGSGNAKRSVRSIRLINNNVAVKRALTASNSAKGKNNSQLAMALPLSIVSVDSGKDATLGRCRRR
jgi:hypothetical protein